MYWSHFSEVMCKNTILSKNAAGQTQYFERILHFQREMRGKHWELYMRFIDWSFNKNNFWRSPDNPWSETYWLMYSNWGLSFRETVPLSLFYIQNDLKIYVSYKKRWLWYFYMYFFKIKTSIYTLNSALLLQAHIRVGNIMTFSVTP